MSNILDKISEMKKEDLEKYQTLIKFFEIIGISKEDLLQLKVVLNDYPVLKAKCDAMEQDIQVLKKEVNDNNDKKQTTFAKIVSQVNTPVERLKL